MKVKTMHTVFHAKVYMELNTYECILLTRKSMCTCNTMPKLSAANFTKQYAWYFIWKQSICHKIMLWFFFGPPLQIVICLPQVNFLCSIPDQIHCGNCQKCIMFLFASHKFIQSWTPIWHWPFLNVEFEKHLLKLFI